MQMNHLHPYILQSSISWDKRNPREGSDRHEGRAAADRSGIQQKIQFMNLMLLIEVYPVLVVYTFIYKQMDCVRRLDEIKELGTDSTNNIGPWDKDGSSDMVRRGQVIIFWKCR